ncbi:lysozyme P-like [Neocloeon triangulifer]|uniref:lysozyme P-like n=1 Tax=Neocloeon triangulifer TaxID=2078957 RepID=UPI00286F990A|nr:lysozyme P-like [Neocloeon triangulifer]
MVLREYRLILLALILFAGSANAKIYERCELAKELRDRLRVPAEQLATWVCIADHESRFNTSIIGTLAEGKDHGLFQISDLFWCETGDIGGACGLDCNSLLDDDIRDDYTCARRIFRAHQGLQGDGFRAWAVYGPHCSSGRAANEAKYTNDCFEAPEVAQDAEGTFAVQQRVQIAHQPAHLTWLFPGYPYYHQVQYYGR